MKAKNVKSKEKVLLSKKRKFSEIEPNKLNESNAKSPNLETDSLKKIVKFRSYLKKVKQSKEPNSERESHSKREEVSNKEVEISIMPTVVVENGVITVNKANYENIKNQMFENMQRDNQNKVEFIDEGSLRLNYLSYINKKIPHEKWTEEENCMFFRALEFFGTDFSMMALIFKGKSRKQLKSKFIKEEKSSSAKIKNCLNYHREKGNDLVRIFRKFQQQQLEANIRHDDIDFKPLLAGLVNLKKLEKVALQEEEESEESDSEFTNN